jgi:hypothetical protein
MAPGVRIVHDIPGRTRLRTLGMKGRTEYFAELQRTLSEIKGVRRVEVNPRTESILIEHESEIQDVLREAEQRGYLRLDDSAQEPYLANINRALVASDEKLRELSSGRLDFETVTFLSFVVGGLYQVTHGHGLPAGVTLFRYAVELATSAGAEALKKRALHANGSPSGSGAAE